MHNITTFVRKRSGDHLGDAKVSKKGTSLREFNFFINCDRQKRFPQKKRRRADLQNVQRGGEMPVNTLHASFFQKFNQYLLPLPPDLSYHQ